VVQKLGLVTTDDGSSKHMSNDPYYLQGKLWGLYGADSASVLGSSTNSTGSNKSVLGIGADSVWAAGNIGDRSVFVAVVDTGVDISAAELENNIFTAPNGANGPHGWDFSLNTDSVVPTSAMDSPHGTHVAGIIGGLGGNEIGIVGVNWQVSIIPVRFLKQDETGDTIAAIQALDYVTTLKTRYHLRVVAINASWTGYSFSSALLGAVKRAANAGILIIAAAGNDGYSNVKSYPANFDVTDTSDGSPKATFNPLISVGAIDANGKLASFSNKGSTTVDLVAPGVGIWSTGLGGGYLQKDGTSMAAPFVTGAVALYAAAHPNASGEEIKQAILTSVVKTKSLQGWTRSGGRLNITSWAAHNTP
jgi:subtilisin family serine protease